MYVAPVGVCNCDDYDDGEHAYGGASVLLNVSGTYSLFSTDRETDFIHVVGVVNRQGL